jgi:hypothetical protein
MSGGRLSRVSARTASEIAGRIDLTAPARALLRPEMSPKQFLNALMDNQQYAEAIRFLAHALRKPEAVWWACACAKEAAGPSPAQPAAAALHAAEKWVSTQAEESRHAALAAAEKAGLTTPAGCAALAAFLSGGSLAPPTVPAVPPAEGACAQAVAGAVVLSAVSRDLPNVQEGYRLALAKGIEVGDGTNRWR